MVNLIEDFSSISLGYQLGGISCLISICLGFFITLFSSIIPTTVALGSVLRDALDVTHIDNGNIKVNHIQMFILRLSTLR